MKKLIFKITDEAGSPLHASQYDISRADFSALDRGDIADTINWGAFSNKGEIEFFDTTGAFTNSSVYIKDFPHLIVKIYYKTNDYETILATFLLDDFEIEPESKKVKLILKDVLSTFQQMEREGYYEYSPSSSEDWWSFNNLLNQLPLASKIPVHYSWGGGYEFKWTLAYLERSTTWELINKICQALMSRCSCERDGEIFFAGDNYVLGKNRGIIIRPWNILSIGNKVKNTQTKINTVSINEKIFTRHNNEPIGSEVPFTWFNVDGLSIDNKLSLSWAGYSPNAYITQTKKDGRNGVFVGTKIKKPDHLYSFGNAVVEANIVQVEISGLKAKIVRSVRSTDKNNEEGFGIYTPDEITVSENINDKNYITVTVTDTYPLQSSPSSESDGTFCVQGGNITALGDFFTEDGEETVGDEDAETILQSNELIQSNSIYSTYTTTKSLAQHIVDTVKSKYINGVECVEMEVTPSIYYDANGYVAVNPLFRKYGLVTPYVVRNGKEQPYSTKYDGSAKSFRVIGIEYSYRGFLRQKLHLQEYVD